MSNKILPDLDKPQFSQVLINDWCVFPEFIIHHSNETGQHQ